jgi:3-phosphoglycerate kinase
MAKKTVADVDVKGKRVLMRVDFNVPLEGDKGGEASLRITDDRRIVQAMPTIKSVIERGGRLILMSHLGRPKGGPEAKYSLKPVAERLRELVNQCQAVPHPHGEGRNVTDLHIMKDPDEKSAQTRARVTFADDCIGPQVEKMAGELRDGDVLLLENLRFHKEEEKNDPNFARQLAKLGDVYVNDAFGTAHREHASTFGAAQVMQGKPRVIGFLIQKELKFLGEAISKPRRPFVAILGGAKVSDKIGVIDHLLTKVDLLILGGGMANTFLLAQGKAIGKSLAEPDRAEDARRILARAEKNGVRVVLPVDVIVAKEVTRGTEYKTLPAEKIPASWHIVDIGKASQELILDALADAKTVFWNGPLGVFEIPSFAHGTKAVARMLAEAAEHGATVVVGGGDSVAAITQQGLADKMTHISTGGGASLEFLEGRELPGVTVLLDRPDLGRKAKPKAKGATKPKATATAKPTATRKATASARAGTGKTA